MVHRSSVAALAYIGTAPPQLLGAGLMGEGAHLTQCEMGPPFLAFPKGLLVESLFFLGLAGCSERWPPELNQRNRQEDMLPHMGQTVGGKQRFQKMQGVCRDIGLGATFLQHG